MGSIKMVFPPFFSCAASLIFAVDAVKDLPVNVFVLFSVLLFFCIDFLLSFFLPFFGSLYLFTFGNSKDY